jgi:hypothetical protein
LTRLCSEDIKTATDLERAAFGFGLGGEEYWEMELGIWNFVSKGMVKYKEAQSHMMMTEIFIYTTC